MLLTNPSSRFLAAFILTVAFAPVLPAQVFISEFMAGNESTLVDEDGETSDWIELYNAGASPVDLAGWCLTDDPAAAYRWCFPSVVLGADSFLVVFASGNDRRNPAGPLHTDFKLAIEGGYLALLSPDLTPVSEYSPSYPPQVEDFSYGLAQNAAFSSLVASGASSKAFPPSDGSLGLNWTQVGFAETGWTAGRTGVGYDEQPTYTSLINTNLISVMNDVSTSAYIRIPFSVPNASLFTGLLFRMKYDDGFVAYLNGTVIARRNAPPTTAWDSRASALHDDAAAVVFEEIDVGGSASLLRDGANVLAIHGLNENLSSSDFLILPELDAVDSGTIDPGVRQFFDKPSPGYGNLPGFPGIAERPAFSRAGGMISGTISLVLSSASPGAAIRYTLNGSEPTLTSTAYTGPIAISATSRVRAKTFVTGFAPSPTVSHGYVQLASGVRTFTSNLPIMVLETFGQGVGESNYTSIYSAVMEPGANGRSSLAAAPQFSSKGAIKFRGSSSLGFPKKSFAFEVRDERENDLAVSLLGLPEESDWVLYAPYTDKTLMRDYLSYLWSNDIGTYAPRGQLIEMFVNSNGGNLDNNDYAGVYVLFEKVKRDDERVDVKRLDASGNAEPDITGGYILKIDRLDPGDSGFSTSRGHVMAYVDPKEQNITPAQRAWIKSYMDAFEVALYGASYRNPVTGYQKYIDPESFVDHHIMVELTKNIDGFRLSTFYHKERDGKLKMGPIWDYNLCLGNANYLDGWKPAGWYNVLLSPGNPDPGDYPWWRQLFTDPDFKQRWVDRWGTLRRTHFDTASLVEDIYETADLLAESQVRNYVRWPILGTYVWPNQFIGQTYEEEIEFMRGWLEQRLAWIDGNYTPSPNFNQYGGAISPSFRLTMTAPTGTIYYKLDGTDPRLPGGARSPDALSYSGPITLSATENTRVIARASVAGTGWSAPADATFVVDPPALVITEIMYHPPQPPLSSLFTTEDHEFIELKNIGSEPLDLTGVHFTAGITVTLYPGGGFSLQPGEYVVLVKNLMAFESVYGLQGINVAGEYVGNLSNAGELLGCKGRLKEPLQEFSYSDLWYPETDGLGHSLVIVDPFAPLSTWGDMASWRTSHAVGGSPGADDVPGGAGGRQVSGDANQDALLDISDALALLLRLFVSGSEPLPCEGASLTDGGNAAVFDVNGDTFVDLADPIHLLAYLFQGGGPPALGASCARVVGCPDVCVR